MPINAAVSKVRCLHDVGDAYSAKPLGTKQGARYLNNALARLRGLFSAYLHVQLSYAA
jgi:hypothetical protein